MNRYLFYITENYSFEILRPLQQEILKRNAEVKWLVASKNINCDNFLENEIVLPSVMAAVDYNPDACFVPGNIIPNFIPGIKVQVFHGLEWKKKGHFQIRGFFDLYCTHGTATTERFRVLEKKHGYFDVVETGWPKIDPLFTTTATEFFDNNKAIILYAPTFSPKLTSAPELFDEIKKLSLTKTYNWLVKFHPKMAKEQITKYQSLNSDNVKVVNSSDINTLFQSADLLISDTSSVIGEFSLLDKVIITYKNSQPGDYLIDIDKPSQLPSAIIKALTPPEALSDAIKSYSNNLHPYSDGHSSIRVLEAVENILAKGKKSQKRKPLNLFRSLKLRKKLSYWKF